jgi:glutaryl-CoA dehydrogenase
MESEVAPIIEDCWAKAKFPFEIVPKLRELDIGGIGY